MVSPIYEICWLLQSHYIVTDLKQSSAVHDDVGTGRFQHPDLLVCRNSA